MPAARQPDQIVIDTTWSRSDIPLAQRRPLLAWLTRRLAWATVWLARHLALGTQHALIGWATWMWQPHLARSIAASRRAHRAQHRAHRASRHSAPATYAEHADELTRRAREIDRMRRDLWRARGRRLAVTAALITLTTVVPWLLPAWQPWPRVASAGVVVLLLGIIGRYVRHEHAIDAEPLPAPEPAAPPVDAGRNLAAALARHLPAVGIQVQAMSVRPIHGGHAVALVLDGATITDVRRRLPGLATRLMLPLNAITVVADPRDLARLTLEILDRPRRAQEAAAPPPPDIVEHVASVLAGVEPGMGSVPLVARLADQFGAPYTEWTVLKPDQTGKRLAGALKPHGVIVDRLPRRPGEKQLRGVLTADVMSVLRERRSAA